MENVMGAYAKKFPSFLGGKNASDLFPYWNRLIEMLYLESANPVSADFFSLSIYFKAQSIEAVYVAISSDDHNTLNPFDS
jgi:hypothetical protein